MNSYTGSSPPGGIVYADKTNMRGCTFALSLCIGLVSDVLDLNEFNSTEEAAVKLKYHVKHVLRMTREGSIEGIKIGRIWLVTRTALNGFMKRKSKVAKHDTRRNK